jgi:hypothetical protein
MVMNRYSNVGRITWLQGDYVRTVRELLLRPLRLVSGVGAPCYYVPSMAAHSFLATRTTPHEPVAVVDDGELFFLRLCPHGQSFGSDKLKKGIIQTDGQRTKYIVRTIALVVYKHGFTT